MGRVDLVVSTGGLGPTPDDLTREAIAGVWGETPVVDPDLERWLRDLWARRDIPFPEANLKQAWRIPSGEPLPNPNGTAPGWFVSGADGRVAIALPGPPREMRPMWADHALPRLRTRGLGADVAVRTYRLTGIGESQVAEILGESMLRNANPEVATYARAEAVDVRISASTQSDPAGVTRTAEALVEDAAATVTERLSAHIWAEGDQTWAGAIGARFAQRGWRLGLVELGTRRAGDEPVRRRRLDRPRRGPPRRRGRRGRARGHPDRSRPRDPSSAREPRSGWRSAPASAAATRPCPWRS